MISNNDDDAFQKQGNQNKHERTIVLKPFWGEKSHDKLDNDHDRKQHIERDTVTIFKRNLRDDKHDDCIQNDNATCHSTIKGRVRRDDATAKDVYDEAKPCNR